MSLTRRANTGVDAWPFVSRTVSALEVAACKQPARTHACFVCIQDLLSAQGWLRLATGGKAEAGLPVHSGQVLVFSFRVSSMQPPAAEVHEAAGVVAGGGAGRGGGGGLRGFCGLERGEWGGAGYCRFGLGLRKGGTGGQCCIALVREGLGAAAGVSAEGASGDGGRDDKGGVELGMVEEGLWYSVEMRVLKALNGESGGGGVRVDVFAGRSGAGGGGSATVGKGRGVCVCSHQSLLAGPDKVGELGGKGAGDGGWTASLQVDRGGVVEFDDWVLRTGKPAPPAPGTGVRGDEEPGRRVDLDRVRNAGYDSLYVPRQVEALDEAKLETFRRKVNNMSQARVDKAQASLRRLTEDLALPRPDAPAADAAASGTGPGAAVEAGGAGGGGGKCVRLGSASMGCGCAACLEAHSKAKQLHRDWQQSDAQVLVRVLPRDLLLGLRLECFLPRTQTFGV